MHLIIGGAYQGKLEYVRKRYGFTDTQISVCTRDLIDLSAPCIVNIEEFAYGCVLREENSIDLFKARRLDWQNSVLICRDISGGLVPVDKTDREWRAATGRLCQYLSREAKTVSRIFCGLEQRLK